MKNMTQLISWFQLEYPEIVSDMRDCTHHLTGFDVVGKPKDDPIYKADKLNPYHYEGDIWTHTMMVCKQAENAPYEVQVAALLHDIGKPSTRAVNAKNGHVSFFNHDAVGAFMALEILKREELGLSREQKIRIFNTIALHTQVFKQTPNQLARICTNNMGLQNLILGLGEVDDAGRFTSISSLTIKVSEMECYDNIPFKKEKEVIVLCGLSGSGKSTYINKNLPDAYTISRDHCLMDLAAQHFQAKDFTYNEAWEVIDQKKVDTLLKNRFKSAAISGKGLLNQIVVDMTHMSKKSRKRSLSHFGPEYKKKCVIFLTDLQEIYLRNENRDGKVIDRRVLDIMMKAFYPPTYEEFDEIEYVF